MARNNVHKVLGLENIRTFFIYCNRYEFVVVVVGSKVILKSMSQNLTNNIKMKGMKVEKQQYGKQC